MIRQQCQYIREIIQEKLTAIISEKDLQAMDIIIGTPEELQGNERDIMIITLSVDENCKYSAAHYQNSQRMNVATSRAKLFNLLVLGKLPTNFHKWKEYIQLHSNFQIHSNEAKINSELISAEKVLHQFILDWIKEQTSNSHLFKIHTQVEACGQRKVLLVIEKQNHTQETSIWVGIEFEGEVSPRVYETDHFYLNQNKKRNDILKRAGWQIIRTPLALWLEEGYLINSPNQNSTHLINEKARLKKMISLGLGIDG